MTNIVPDDSRVVVDEKASKSVVIKRYLIAIAVSIVMLVLVLYSKGIFGEYDAMTNTVDLNATAWAFHILCDSFSITGVICCCAAGLLFCSNKGAYDGLFFGVRQAIGVMFKDPHKLKYKDLYEYKQAKSKNRAEYRYILWIGLVYLFVGIVFLVVYNNANIA